MTPLPRDMLLGLVVIGLAVDLVFVATCVGVGGGLIAWLLMVPSAASIAIVLCGGRILFPARRSIAPSARPRDGGTCD